MDLAKLKNIYLIGIGGIGMSALARYFKQKGLKVSGYDKSETALTHALQSEGINIIYEADEHFVDVAADLVIYTPAVKQENSILRWYETNNYPVYKRSVVLQWIVENMTCVTVAGTHGKTTISTMIAHLFRAGNIGGYAFLGGISVNYKTNFWKVESRRIAVIEADEYDRSFLRLSPDIAILTAMDSDHLDVYGNKEALVNAYVEYTQNIKPNGTLWYKHGLHEGSRLKGNCQKTYSLQNDAADAYADNIRMKDGGYFFDWKNNVGTEISQLWLGIGGMHNVENAVVAIAIALEKGLNESEIRDAIAGFKGVKRRFEYILKNDQLVYIDDYAHHPKELETLIQSAKTLFPDKKCTLVFQPHLYSRTRDLASEFANSFNRVDEVILLEIYPAREEPLLGITSKWLKEQITQVPCTVLTKEGLLRYVEVSDFELLITAGAGDIDQLVQPIKERLQNKNKQKGNWK